MAITTTDLQAIQAGNPTLKMSLFPDTNGVINNRVILYGLNPDNNSVITITKGAVNVTGLQVQKAYYTSANGSLRMFYKTITPTFI